MIYKFVIPYFLYFVPFPHKYVCLLCLLINMWGKNKLTLIGGPKASDGLFMKWMGLKRGGGDRSRRPRRGPALWSLGEIYWHSFEGKGRKWWIHQANLSHKKLRVRPRRSWYAKCPGVSLSFLYMDEKHLNMWLVQKDMSILAQVAHILLRTKHMTI